MRFAQIELGGRTIQVTPERIVISPDVYPFQTGHQYIIDANTKTIRVKPQLFGIPFLPFFSSTYKFDEVQYIGRKRADVYSSSPFNKGGDHLTDNLRGRASQGYFYQLVIYINKYPDELPLLTVMCSWDPPIVSNPLAYTGKIESTDTTTRYFDELIIALRQMMGFPEDHERIGDRDPRMVMYTCPNCGKTITEGLKRCFYCSHELNE